jgi:Leucine Rich repeat
MNSITAKGIESLSLAVKDMHLTHLNLKNNNIGNDGLKHLENAIPYVQVLNISILDL